MPRVGRLHIVGGCYHVMGRGLERRRVFASEEDKQDFVTRLENGLTETKTECLAWSVMPNHYHLLLRVGATPLGSLMRKLLGGYATSYNRRHRRGGYVFQNRYKSILCDEDNYLLELVRYIHLNPLRAKLVTTLSTLERYRWTGHGVLMGKRQADWQQTQAVLGRFGRRVSPSRQKYRDFMKQGLGRHLEIDYSGGGLIRSYGGWQNLCYARKEHERKIGDERILGDSGFVEASLKQDDIEIEARTRYLEAGWDLPHLIEVVCKHFDIAIKQITDKGRRNQLSNAKSVICYLGTMELGLSTVAIAKRLAMSQAAVSMSSRRGRLYFDAHSLGMDSF